MDWYAPMGLQVAKLLECNPDPSKGWMIWPKIAEAQGCQDCDGNANEVMLVATNPWTAAAQKDASLVGPVELQPKMVKALQRAENGFPKLWWSRHRVESVEG
jgi:hypothetical protein